MEKAAIEIPEDYLSGLKNCGQRDEDGDLSSFDLEAMLGELGEAAKEDKYHVRRYWHSSLVCQDGK